MIVTVRHGQSLQDIAKQYYGSAEGVSRLLIDNPSLQSLDDTVETGDLLVITEGAEIDPAAVDFLRLNKHVVSTGAEDVPFRSFSDAFGYGYDI